MSDNKRIFSNTLHMAIRMFATMAVTLYTSRVVLQQLGVEDFGIYTVVGGLALIMSFFTSALTAAIQRYLNVELAIGGKNGLQEVFSACWGCVIALSIAFLILAEGAGLWFLNNELNIAPDRMADARIVFQMSLVIVVIEMLRVPYNSLIIAHERMSFYAYNSIVEVSLKLATAILLSLTPGNKLLIYMTMLIAVAFIINVSYVIYCRLKLPRVYFSLRGDRSRMLEIGKFAGWNVITSLSDISYQQGTSMILNIFYGVALNASMGIANQVKTAIFAFTRSVQLAANPQIIKSYAAGNHSVFESLFLRISKVSFFFVLLIGIPIFLNIDFILSIWLSVIPPMAAIYAKLMIIFCIIDSLVGPLWVSMQATGNIARYQITISISWLMSLPLTYLAFKAGLPGYWLLWIMIGIDSILIAIRVKFTEKYCGIPAATYFRQVIARVVSVTAAALAVTLGVMYLCAANSQIIFFFISSSVWCVSAGVAIWFIGLTEAEREIAMKFIKKHIKV